MMDIVTQIYTAFAAIQSAFLAIYMLHLTDYKYPQQGAVQNGDCFDYIVIGAGSAGCVLANRLTEDPGITVLLLEIGGYPPMEANTPGLAFFVRGSIHDWGYTAADSCNYECRVNNTDLLSRGKTLGGSSSINAAFWVRGDPHDYDNWADLTNDTSWSYKNVLPYFIKSEQVNDPRLLRSPTRRFRGTNGPLKVTYTNSPEVDNYLDAHAELGYRTRVDLNAKDTMGFSYAQVTIADDIRQSTANTYLSQAKDRPNLTLLTKHLATKINFIGNVAHSVDVLNDKGEKMTFVAKKEIISSAGAINSAQLLMLSGIGPEQHLKSLGINVIADLPVGTNMQDHKLVALAYAMGPAKPKKAKNPGEYPFPTIVGASALSKSQKYPDYQILSFVLDLEEAMQLSLLYLLFKPDVVLPLMSKAAGREVYCVIHNNLRPKSRGRVLLRSTDPTEHPLIYTDPYENLEDLENEAKFIEHYSPIINTTFFKSVGAEFLALEKCVHHGVGTLEYYKCHSKCLVSTLWHYSGTCAIGSVVDNFFRVLNTKKLRVVDAGTMPIIVSGNTNAPTIMMAEKAADIIKEANRNWGDCYKCT